MLFILLSYLTILSTISIFHTEIRCVWVFSGCWYWKDIICYQRHCWYNRVIIIIIIIISGSALLNFFLVWLELLNFQSHDPLGFLRNAVKDNKPAVRVGPLVALQPEINLFYIVVIPLMVQISQNVTVSPFFSTTTTKKNPQTTPSWTWRYFSLTDATGNECCRVTLNCRLLPSAHPLFSGTFAFNFNNTKTYLDLGWYSVLNDGSLWLCFHVWTFLVETLLRLLTQLHTCCDPFLWLSSLCFCKRGVYFLLYKNLICITVSYL